MTDSGGNGGSPPIGLPMGDRIVDILIGRDDGKDFSTITVKDKETTHVLINIEVPDAALIDQTYRLGGGVEPLIAMQALCMLGFNAILTSFQLAIQALADGNDQPDTD